MMYFALHELGLDFEEALFEVPASRIMLMFNQHTLVNLGEEKMMTLSDMEALRQNG